MNRFLGSRCLKVIADLCIVPVGVGVTGLSKFVAACEHIFEAKGLKRNLHAYGTNVEGEMKDVLDALQECHEKLHEMGSVRIHSTVKIGSRVDRVQSMEDKIESVERRLKAHSADD
eukprot:TRINITY_DN1273_c1_g1_i1.p1 TRINITY_DN1273_c1_g1~~TRINITY_DN1273_c1_g1_i1.p1  ORF type:complete len:116 (+),score=27.51 TRINITY_DN1273_c1_g1_i1:118-465(+)